MTNFCYKYPRPALTADSAVFFLHSSGLEVLLIKRKNDPFQGNWALPGGFMDMDEEVHETARRELKEETGLDLPKLTQIGAFSDVDRDPRGRTVTVAFFALSDTKKVCGGDDAVEAQWFSLEKLPVLAFDHRKVLVRALRFFKKQILLEKLTLQHFPESSRYRYLEKLNSAVSELEFTPEMILKLREDEVFVFGSNLSGQHGGGAARLAYQKFGAEWGVGVGMTGQCYAIPTMQGGVDTIRPYVDDFISFAMAQRQFRFLVTRIGCGIAGFRDEEIAPLFSRALESDNIFLPRSFYEVLTGGK